MIAGHLTPLHSCCESLICLQGEGFRQDSLMEVIICQEEGKWGRGDVLNSPWANSSVWCTDLLHCLCTRCTASRVHSLRWRITTSPPYTLVWSLHLQADQTATDKVVTSLTWKQGWYKYLWKTRACLKGKAMVRKQIFTLKMNFLWKYKIFHNSGSATNICKIVTNFFVTLCPPHLHSISNCVIAKPCLTSYISWPLHKHVIQLIARHNKCYKGWYLLNQWKYH